MIENAKPIPHKEILTFHELRQEIRNELQNQHQVVESVKTLRLEPRNHGSFNVELTVLTGVLAAGKQHC